MLKKFKALKIGLIKLVHGKIELKIQRIHYPILSGFFKEKIGANKVNSNKI